MWTRCTQKLFRVKCSDLLCLSVLDVLASVEASQVVSQLPSKYGVEAVRVALHQFTIQLEDHVLGHRHKPGCFDGWSFRPAELSQVAVLCGVVQLVGMNKNQVGLLNTLEKHGGFTWKHNPQKINPQTFPRLDSSEAEKPNKAQKKSKSCSASQESLKQASFITAAFQPGTVG